MSEEIKKNEQPKVEEQPKEQPKEQPAQQPAPITLSMISKGTLELAVPIRARSEDISVLHYDFTKLSGWEYVEAMDSDTASRNVFQVSKKQALALFAVAAAKQAPVDEKGGRLYDASDIKQRISLFDAQRAVQVATVFLVRSAQEAGKNTYGR